MTKSRSAVGPHSAFASSALLAKWTTGVVRAIHLLPIQTKASAIKYHEIMRSLKWSISHAVFVTEIDDEHKEIFEAVASLRKALASRISVAELRNLAPRLVARIVEHFAHEERLMRAARYGSLRWHKRQHDNARRRVGQFVLGIEQGEPRAAGDLIEYLTSWLPDHSRLADRMMSAFLRNHRLMWKVTLRAGTKPIDACPWVDTNGDAFDPSMQR